MKDKIIIDKMLRYVNKAIGYCEGYDQTQFEADDKTVEACVFNLSQLGELCRVLDENFMKENSHIPWREMYGLRNRIVHDYEGVNLMLVWDVISEDLPVLKEQLLALKDTLQ